MANVKLGSKAVGSIVKIEVKQEEREFIIVHQGKPSSLYDESCDGTWLLMKDIYKKASWDNGTVNDYAYSDIHRNLQEKSGFQVFLDDIYWRIAEQIKQVKIPYRPGSGTSQTVNSKANGLSARVFLLSASEVGYTKSNCAVGFVSGDGFVSDGAKLSYFKSSNGTSEKIAKFEGAAEEWYLRTPYITGGRDVWGVKVDGYAGNISCAWHLGIRPAFVLPSSLLVSDDGSIIPNTAPSVPISITIPDCVNGGSSITISWAKSTDSEGNLEGYIVERSTDGGSSWKQIYQGSGTSATNSIPFGTASVMYRVKAYDDAGLQSGWRTSSQVNVHNNTAPTVPENINVPDSASGGEPLTITWGQSTDIDGDPICYILERQTDGGTWTKLYEGAEQTYTDSIIKGWKTVAYRVKAYDSYNSSSAYVTSETRTVNNNTAPVISGEDAALGVKTGSFSQAYTVSDAENNTVTVTEYVDNQVIRSYQAVLGQDGAITISRENWLKLTNGNHQLRVTASDGISAATRIWTFSKKETVICFRMAAPMETETAAARILVSPTWKIDGAAVRVEACNNAFDEAPAWEDITAMLTLKRVYHFTNTAKTADKWGLDIRFTIEKNEGYEGEVSITGFGVAYE